MNWLIRLLRAVFVIGPRELLMALLKLLFLVLVLLLLLLLLLWEWLVALFRGKHLFPEDRDPACGRLPEAIIRRPDPAIYSQRLLQSQGLPVTWNNPDIWIAPAANPTAVEPDSYHLTDDTDYIVSVQAHNASTDAAIGVRVRLNYRPWSFNSPDLTPVETDADGNEVVRFVDIPPMSAAVAAFNWHTPPVPAGQETKHYCLQASLYHPLDTNTANNMGQENTNVWRSDNPGLPAAGDTVRLDLPLFNHSRRARRYRFQALKYAIEAKEYELTLETTRGHARRSPRAKVANLIPSLQSRTAKATVRAVQRDGSVGSEPERTFRDRFSVRSQPDVVAVKNRYGGWDKIREDIEAQDVALPTGMRVAVAGGDPAAGVEVGGRAETTVPFEIKVPDDAPAGTEYPVTLLAMADDGVLAGGVTVILKVRE